MIKNKKEFILIDFDLIKKSTSSDLIYYSSNLSGTANFISPENYHGIYGGFSDIWGLGMTLYTCLISKCPCSKNKILWDDLYKSNISIYAKHFILSCLVFNYKYRASSFELLKHPWITENAIDKDILNKYFEKYLDEKKDK